MKLQSNRFCKKSPLLAMLQNLQTLILFSSKLMLSLSKEIVLGRFLMILADGIQDESLKIINSPPFFLLARL